MGDAPQVTMRVASQIWQIVFASQRLQVFRLALRKKAQYVVVKNTTPNHAYAWDRPNTNVTSVITMLFMHPIGSISHIVELLLEFCYFNVVFASTCIPFLKFTDIIRFQLFKNSQPYFTIMCLHKVIINF